MLCKSIISTLIALLLITCCFSNPVNAKQNAPKNTIAVTEAHKYLGNRYRHGAVPRTYESPSDCSGLILAIFRKIGIELPRTAREQSRVGAKVDVTEMRPGDLVFFGNRGRIRHVGIYIGGLNFIHSSSAAGYVTISTLRRSIAKVVRPYGRI